MSSKTRGNYVIPFCIKQWHCANHGELCKECIRYSKLKPKHMKLVKGK